MATAHRMHIVPEDTGLWKVPQTDESAKKVTELLQQDMRDHHVFFNEDGFHNHIVHHMLSLYGTGAGPASLQKGYDGNANYQRPARQAHDRVPEALGSWDEAQKYLGNEKYYPDFLAFFQREIDRTGWEAVVNEYVFKGDARADDLFGRLFAGFLHPLIQLMYGLEWKQPALVAEGLAQASVHSDSLNAALFAAEKLAASASTAPMPSIVSLLEDVAADEKLRTAARLADANKVRDGVLARARDEMLRVAAKVKVRPEELDERTAEMFDACVYEAAAAAVHPPKHVKFDFFLMHHVNSAPFFLTVNAAPWIPAAAKVRLLEFKIRLDLIQYAARACPPLSLDRITSYRPKPKDGIPPEAPPEAVVPRLHDLDDDGHAIKLARAAVVCRELTRPYRDREWLMIKGDDAWRQVLHMIVDSVEEPGQRWVRGAGDDAAWKDIPDAPKL